MILCTLGAIVGVDIQQAIVNVCIKLILWIKMFVLVLQDEGRVGQHSSHTSKWGDKACEAD